MGTYPIGSNEETALKKTAKKSRLFRVASRRLIYLPFSPSLSFLGIAYSFHFFATSFSYDRRLLAVIILTSTIFLRGLSTSPSPRFCSL